jgi:tetratricopeptide (TPR) repeat protein
MNLDYANAKYNLLNAIGDFGAEFFEINGYTLESAYCHLLNKNLSKAKELFLTISDKDKRAHWGAILVSLCDGKVDDYPSYFELRNFFEVDINIMCKYYLGNFIENICSYSDWLATINPEIYKYLGRIFIKNNYPDIGITFLKRGKDYFFNDPELHFLLAEYYFSNKDFSEAKHALTNCLNILPDYFPAESMLDKIP